MVAETVAGGQPAPAIRSLAPARTSYVCAVMPRRRVHISRIYTEYPNLTHAWLRHSRTFRGAEVVILHGSLEGIVALDSQSAGVLLEHRSSYRARLRPACPECRIRASGPVICPRLPLL